MTTFTFFIGGKLVRGSSDWFYGGGKSITQTVDVDVVSFYTILDFCGENQFKNVKELWYDNSCAGKILRDRLRVINGDTFSEFMNYMLEKKHIKIYVEHGNYVNRYFTDQNPKIVCENLGIDEHGHDIEKGKNVLYEMEFDGYTSELGENAYERDGHEELFHCPYRSCESDEEFCLGRDKMVNFRSRMVKRSKKNPDDVAGLDDIDGLDNGVGLDDGAGPSRFVGQKEYFGPGNGGGSEIPTHEREFDNLDIEIRRVLEKRGGASNTAPRRRSFVEEESEFVEENGSDYSYLTSSSESDAEHGQRVAQRRLRFSKSDLIPIFRIDMVFDNKSVFKKAVERHAIHWKRDVKFVSNDSRRLRAVCKDKECKWVILCSIDSYSNKWMVKTLVNDHTCQRQFHLSCLTYKTIAQWFIIHLKKYTLKFSISEMQDHFRAQTKLMVSRGQLENARKKIIDHYIGDPSKEFARLEDYVEELRNSNPGSTVVLEHERGLFKRMYVCFAGVRKGFIDGCRPIIGLDGCFLKGPFKGEILSAVGRDGNDQIYPICWAVVSYECKETWTWFLELLMADLDVAAGNYVYGDDGTPIVPRGKGLTFISDQQKGLIAAIAELMPAGVHRRCARHIFSKWRKVHNTEELHCQFWVTCRAASAAEFANELEVMKSISVTAAEDFLEIPPKHWCRAFQYVTACSDVVDSNMCETFNSLILESRYKSIVKLLELIRIKVFKRFKERNEFVSKFKDGFGPKVWKEIKEAIDERTEFTVDSNGKKGYEVRFDENIHWTVDIDKWTCDCRKWDLTGIPCSHALCVILSQPNLDVKQFVSHWYSEGHFKLTYNNPIRPVRCMRFWPRVVVTKISPPNIVKFPGRPRKLRKREGWEPSKGEGNASRKGRKMTCSVCKSLTHRAHKCPLTTGPSEVPSTQPAVPAIPTDSLEVPVQQEKKRKLCSYCRMEGHRKDRCTSNPTSKNFINPSNSQVPLSQPTPSQIRASQFPAASVPNRTEQVLSELRQSIGSTPLMRGRPKKMYKNKGKVTEGFGILTDEPGLNQKTPVQRVLNAAKKSKKNATAGSRGTILEEHLAKFRRTND